MILRKYILIFTLALISCAGTSYIHSLSEHRDAKSESQEESKGEKEVFGDNFGKMKAVIGVLEVDQLN